MKKELEKVYEPKQVEDKTYRFWLEKRYFHAEPNPKKKPYTIVIPPPNITGQLHLGHALDCTLQDSIIRFKRMQGYAALWLPGTDHASIATEAKIVAADDAKRALPKRIVGRDGFLERAWEWKEDLRRPHCRAAQRSWARPATGSGNALRWTRAALRRSKKFLYASMKRDSFTGASASSTGAPTAMTSISDAEVEYEEQRRPFLASFVIPCTDGSGYLELATTRPETHAGRYGGGSSTRMTNAIKRSGW